MEAFLCHSSRSYPIYEHYRFRAWRDGYVFELSLPHVKTIARKSALVNDILRLILTWTMLLNTDPCL
jgi:hypothetical protein